MRHLASRLRKLEPKAPVPAGVPHVLEVAEGETVEAAFACFCRRYPHVRPGHAFMVVPATLTPAEAQRQGEARRAERHRRFQGSGIEGHASL